MGSPSNVTLFFQGQDVLMLPSSGYRVTVFAHHCALVQKRPCFLQYLLRGVYHRPSWMIGDWQGLPVLRVKNACFTYVSRKWLTSWHDLEEQPGGNS
jgi:hypothetical protein